ncbi:MAG: hypothetical protein KGZ59_06685 [Chitinophagaceae bacterium]|nr:hypothetical protein [Chitinophagaceae bacterium]
MHFFQFIYILIYRAFYILLQKKKEAAFAAKYIKKLELQFEGEFDEKTFKKIVFYYSLKVPAIYDAFLSLHRRRTFQHEKERLLKYFICSSVFDNFFDRRELNDEEIYQITFNSNQYQPKTFTERIALYCHLDILNSVKDKTSYLQVLHFEYEAQVNSRKQCSVTITNKEIEDITLSKGGNAVLLCSFYLDILHTEAELNCWYKLGNAIQLVNDLFDIYKDVQSGLQTIPNRVQKVDELKNYYNNFIQQVKVEINNIPIQSSKKLHLKISLMGICALGVVAIHQLKNIETKYNGLPKLNTLTRKDLIIDMEKFSNIWLWLKTVYFLSKN